MATTTPASDNFTQELQRIRGLIEIGELQRAAHALNAALEQAPSDARVPLLGMRLAQRAGNTAGAIQAARQALRRAPDWHVAQIELALLLAQSNHQDEAIQLAMQALANSPKDEQVMAGAINVALHCGNESQTLAWAEDGVRRFPDDAGIRLFLARWLFTRERYLEARAQYEYLFERVPHSKETLSGLLGCATKLGETDQARTWADRLLALSPDNEQVVYMHALAHGRVPSTQPASSVARTFDDYAERFDMHLVGGLKYRVPERVAQILLGLHPDRRFNLLDLGCGTGLVGLYLGRIDGHIVGADLSAKMIEQAARHEIYSRFYQVNVLDALRETPADYYEAITCADVLVYVGDLGPVIPNAARILKPGGHFIFSCESASEEEADLVLRPSQRFAHKASSVKRLCHEAGFTEVLIEDLPTLRMESGQPLPGFLVTAQKSLAA